jgi:DNA-binding MarR family transcriptional regulator
MTLISKPSLSRLLPALEARRLVRRSAAAHDLRGASIRIAPAGRALIAAVSPHSEARYREIEATIGAEAMAALYALLPRLSERLESVPPPAAPVAAPPAPRRARGPGGTAAPPAGPAARARA